MNFLKTYKKIETHYYYLAVAAVILAFEPVFWLVNTWTDPSYDSKGFYIFAICLGLFIWSVTSPNTTRRPINRNKPFLLLCLSAGVRLIGQVAAINVVGALTLVFDVYAVSQLAGLHNRKRSVSPVWLAVCFAFSLPLERIIQRSIGYVLQNISADGACSVLGTFFENVTCHGVRILINAQDVMVDLPCSGARSVLLLLFFYCVCASVSRLNTIMAVLGLGITLLSALIINVVRICVLAIGIAFPVSGLDVMEQPLHDLIGLFMLALGAAPTLYWVRRYAQPQKSLHPVLDRALWCVPKSVKQDAWWLESKPARSYKNAPALFAMLCVMGALVISHLPRQAMDVSRKNIPLDLPHSLSGKIGMSRPLSAAEERYFKQFGGSAKKAAYGDHGLLMVKSTAPLRHLHAPDECLRGLGMDVEYKGPNYDVIPSAIYKATDQNGNSYRIAVSFVSEDHKIITTNISEAVWRWMQNPTQAWTAIQRISPWDGDTEEDRRFDDAVVASLDIQIENKSIQLASIGEK